MTDASVQEAAPPVDNSPVGRIERAVEAYAEAIAEISTEADEMVALGNAIATIEGSIPRYTPHPSRPVGLRTLIEMRLAMLDEHESELDDCRPSDLNTMVHEGASDAIAECRKAIEAIAAELTDK
jgi:hypothetical protein